MLLPILKYGAPELKAVCGPVDFFNTELEKIARNMVETMYAAHGIGLAATQVGLTISLTSGEYFRKSPWKRRPITAGHFCKNMKNSPDISV